MKFLFLLAVVAMILIGCASDDREFGFMTEQEAYELIASGAEVIVLDVRSEEEFLSGHVEGSVLLPLDDVQQHAESILLDKDSMILIICRSGNRSQTASQELVNLGFTNVYDIGGVINWPKDLVK